MKTVVCDHCGKEVSETDCVKEVFPISTWYFCSNACKDAQNKRWNESKEYSTKGAVFTVRRAGGEL